MDGIATPMIVLSRAVKNMHSIIADKMMLMRVLDSVLGSTVKRVGDVEAAAWCTSGCAADLLEAEEGCGEAERSVIACELVEGDMFVGRGPCWDA